MKEILIGDKKFVGSQKTDEYIEIELSREIETLKIDSLINEFDFQEQFLKERRESYKFCVYGIVESRYGHCDGVPIHIKIGDTTQTPMSNWDIIYTPQNFSGATTGYSNTILSKQLSNNGILTKNVYGTNKGCFFFHFELNKDLLTKDNSGILKNKSIYFQVFDPSRELYLEDSFPILFFDEGGAQIEFGTETADFNVNNEIIEINNNFPFFYDKHWVKHNLELNGPPIVFFENNSMTVVEESAAGFTIPISLSEPSKFGMEKVKVIIDYNTTIQGLPITNASLGADFLFNEQVISWNSGEQTKQIPINILDDLFVENIEKIQFRIIPLVNSRVSINTNNSMILYVQSSDIPVFSYFQIATEDIFRPQENISRELSHEINILFSSPLPVEGESIKVRFDRTQSTAILGTDFILDINNPSSDEIIIYIPQNSNQTTISSIIKSHRGYIEDKLVVLNLIQNSLGIIPSSQNPQSFSPSIKITLKDSTEYKYVNYVIPINPTTNTGLYRTFFRSNIVGEKITLLKTGIFDSNANPATDQLELTKDFSCKLKITNKGDKIIYNNLPILQNDSFEINLSLSSITENINITLPSNQNWHGNFYDFCNYDFEFNNFDKFYPSTINPQQHNSFDRLNEYVTRLTRKVFAAGSSSDTSCYLITELQNVKSTYDDINDSCTTDTTNLNSNIKYNGGVFINQYPVPQIFKQSKTELYFSDKVVVNECQNTGNTLPVGINLLTVGPYNEKFSNVHLGPIYFQINFNTLNLNDKMSLAKMISPGVFQNSYKYFYDWNMSSLATKRQLRLEIKNNGIRDVVFLGKTIFVNQSTSYNYSDLDFTNITLLLPTNDVYNNSTNSFEKINYGFKINNILIPERIINNNNFETVTSIDLGQIIEFGPSSSSSLNINTPNNYFFESKYKDINLSSDISNRLDCSTPMFNNPYTITRKVKINGILAFLHTGSKFTSSSFKTSQINPDCPNSSIPFAII